MSNPVIRVRWKQASTATDMTEMLRYCRGRGWRVVSLGWRGGWWIFTRPDENLDRI